MKKSLRQTILTAFIFVLLSNNSFAQVTTLTTYNYLKSQQQTAVIAYLNIHSLDEDDVVPFYYDYHPYNMFPNTYMPSKDSNNPNDYYVIDNDNWPSTEHYYQAMKFPGNPSYRQTIQKASSGGRAAKLGQASKPGKLDYRTWNNTKKQVMYHALQAKFSGDKVAAAELLGTGDKILLEAAAGSTNFKPDFTWGIGDDGTGKNWLGELLMQVRDELRTKQNTNNN